MADYQQADADRFLRDRRTDEWFLAAVRAAVWGHEPITAGSLWDDGETKLSLPEKKALLKERMEKLWPKPQP